MPIGVGKGGGFVAVGVSVGGKVFVGVGDGPRVDVAVAVAVLVAVGGDVGELVAVDTMGGDNVLVGEGEGVSVACSTMASAGVSAPSCSAAWLTSSGRLENMPSADSSRTTRKRMPTQPTPSI